MTVFLREYAISMSRYRVKKEILQNISAEERAWLGRQISAKRRCE